MIVDCFIVCDDIRSELGNKYSLMGIYLDSVVFQRLKGSTEVWPKALKLGFYIRLVKEQEDMEVCPDSTFNFYSERDGKTELLGNGIINDRKAINQNGKFVITIIHNPFIFTKPDNIKFFIEFFNNDKKKINKKILLGELSVIDREV